MTWFTTAQAAKHLAVSVDYIRRAARSGSLRHVRVGRDIRTTPEWCDQFLLGQENSDNATTDDHDIERRV